MPREFIPQVDDANAEIVRLDAALATAEANATTLTAAHATAIAALNATHAKAITDLEASHATAIASAKTTHDAAIAAANLKSAQELAAKDAETVKLLAQANIPPGTVKTTSTTSTPQLTGLQRAIAANIAAQNPTK